MSPPCDTEESPDCVILLSVIVSSRLELGSDSIPLADVGSSGRTNGCSAGSGGAGGGRRGAVAGIIGAGTGGGRTFMPPPLDKPGVLPNDHKLLMGF